MEKSWTCIGKNMCKLRLYAYPNNLHQGPTENTLLFLPEARSAPPANTFVFSKVLSPNQLVDVVTLFADHGRQTRLAVSRS